MLACYMSREIPANVEARQGAGPGASPAQRGNLKEKTKGGAKRCYAAKRGAGRGCGTTNLIGMTKEAWTGYAWGEW